MLTLLNKISKFHSIKLLTRGGGVKKVQKYADVICESPLRGQLNYDPLECPVENLTYLETREKIHLNSGRLVPNARRLVLSAKKVVCFLAAAIWVLRFCSESEYRLVR